MTIWKPKLAGRAGPIYLAIADAVADDVARGQLAAGTQMPTHRDLAEALGVTVGTVSRAYREARSRGLMVGEVGRGTFVRGAEPHGHPPGLRIPETNTAGVIDLSLNFLRLPGMQSIVARSLAELAEAQGTHTLLEDYHPQAGSLEHRIAGTKWLERSGLHVDPEQVLVCSGAQHAMTVALLATTRPGDGLLVSRLTYPAAVALARSLHLELHGVDMDEDGLRPEALEAACRAHKPRALYCMPNLHNPTTRVMPASRRLEVAEVAARHGLTIIEDDVYGFLLDAPPPPIVAAYRHRGYLIASVSKSLAPGLRIGYLALPVGDRSRFIDTLWATTVMAPPLMAQLATRWIVDGTADLMIEGRRAEARARQTIAAEELAALRYESHPGALQCWVQLPPPWRAADFVARAAQRGVMVNSSDTFAVGHTAAPAIRIALGGARSQVELRHGLRILAELVGAGLPACVV